MTSYYITKYALSTGIFELNDTNTVELEITGPGHLFVRRKGNSYGNDHFSIGEFFETREAAIEDAERRRKKKIESLNKQIDKLRRLEFF